MAEKREEMRQILRNNWYEPTILVVQPNMDEEQSEEGNYSRTASQDELCVIRRNQPIEGDDGCGCKYKDFMTSKPLSLYGSPTSVRVMDWISMMEIVLESITVVTSRRPLSRSDRSIKLVEVTG